MRSLNIAVIGGDLRQVKLCELLHSDGHMVKSFALDRENSKNGITPCKDIRETIEKAHCVILPLPVEKEDGVLNAPLSETTHKIEEIFESIPAGMITAGGNMRSETTNDAANRGIRVRDYFKREELAVLNAVATAEGAIQVAMEETPITLHGSKTLVIGNGRIGQKLAMDLNGLGSDVTVSARKHLDFAKIYSAGLNSINTSALDGWIGGFDVIFNTVPSKILTEPILRQAKKDCLIIDLASKPGGVDFKAAQEIGVKVIWALSLPGKVAPITSAEAIKETIYNILSEEGVI